MTREQQMIDNSLLDHPTRENCDIFRLAPRFTLVPDFPDRVTKDGSVLKFLELSSWSPTSPPDYRKFYSGWYNAARNVKQGFWMTYGVDGLVWEYGYYCHDKKHGPWALLPSMRYTINDIKVDEPFWYYAKQYLSRNCNLPKLEPYTVFHHGRVLFERRHFAFLIHHVRKLQRVYRSKKRTSR